MLHLYDYLPSGNGYKVRLVLHKLDIEFKLIELDLARGATRTPRFLKKNPNGRIPVLERHDGSCISESNAIMFYLAEGTELWPSDRLGQARALQWMFFEQYSHEPNIAVPRAWAHQPDGLTPLQKTLLPDRMLAGYRALDVMEEGLAGREFFVDDRFSLADIALYAYTHVAHEGGFDLTNYPAIRAWLDRVAALPRHVPITWRPGGE